MTLRKLVKRWLYGSCPGLAGCFPYFGTRIYFPKGSHSFHAACDAGIFEEDNTRLLRGLVTVNSTMFDVGANIGLMAVPVLEGDTTVNVISFEPSPNSSGFLERTISESKYTNRWSLVKKAVTDCAGTVSFHLSESKNSLFDGVKPTGRATTQRNITVETTTLDLEWIRLQQPNVSVIKIDVEGGELAVLRGAIQLITECSPYVVLEWNKTNLIAHGVEDGSIFELSKSIGYHIYSLPAIIRIESPASLKLHQLITESFLLAPPDNESCPAP